MELLNKFSAVQIETDRRISEEDKAFCQRQQDAFDKSGPALQKLADLMLSIEAEQRAIFANNENDAGGYLSSRSNYTCDDDHVYEAMKHRNETFIDNIVHYFAGKYTVDLDGRIIREHLIPAEPKSPKLPWLSYQDRTEAEIDKPRANLDVYKKEKNAWELSLRALPLRYEQIVDEIFVQLGGFSFEEQAMNEFLQRTWNACHYTHSSSYRNVKAGDERFEISNATIKIPDGISYSSSKYRPTANFITLLDALAFYQCGRMNEGHLWFPDFRTTYDGPKENIVYTRNMSKVESIKLFKNGRADIKFRSAAYAQEFAEQCLRRRPSKSGDNN